MQEGELWWFDPTVSHEACNDADEDRIHIIFDVLSRQSLRAFFNAGVRGLAWPIRQRSSRGLAKN